MNHSLHFYYAATVMLAAICLGGGTQQALWSDHVIALLLLPAVFLGWGQLPSTRLGAAGKLLAIGVAVVCAMQFAPVGRGLAEVGFPGAESGLRFWSSAPGKSLESVLFIVSASGFMLFVARFTDEDQFRLYRVFVIGLLVQMTAAMIQLSFDKREPITGFLPFGINAGLFANENHLSSLIFFAIPLFAYRYLVRTHQPLAFAGATAASVLFLFAVGSRAGIAIGLMMALVSFAWLKLLRKSMALRALSGIVAAGLILAAMVVLGDSNSLDSDLRLTFFANTLAALKDNWLWGTGLGSFVLIYPGYEPASDILRVYANHAHNDFLEIALETGVAGMLLMALFVWLVVSGSNRSQFAQAANLSILALMIHSLVDYPLRTYSIAIPFAWLCAVAMSSIAFGRSAPESARELISEAAARPRYRPAASGLARGLPELAEAEAPEVDERIVGIETIRTTRR